MSPGSANRAALRPLLAPMLILLLGSLHANPSRAAEGIWTSPAELAVLPTSGKAWNAMLAKAREPIESPDVSDQDDPDNLRVLAREIGRAHV